MQRLLGKTAEGAEGAVEGLGSRKVMPKNLQHALLPIAAQVREEFLLGRLLAGRRGSQTSKQQAQILRVLRQLLPGIEARKEQTPQARFLLRALG